MTELTNIKGILMMVRTLAMRWMILALMLASGPEPNAGSYEAGDRLIRARKRSSERTATALMRRTQT